MNKLEQKDYSSFLSKFVHNPKWLEIARNKAFATFCQKGFPTQKDERWRNISLNNLSLEQLIKSSNSFSKKEDITWPKLSDYFIHFVNGKVVSVNLPKKITAHSLEDMQGTDELQEFFEGKDGSHFDAFVLLNTAYFDKGCIIDVPDDVEIDTPIQLVFFGDADKSVNYLRNVFVVGKNSKVNFIEYYIGDDHKEYLTNVVTHGKIGANATVDFCRIINQGQKSNHIENIEILQEDNSKLKIVTASIDGKMIRSEIKVRLLEKAQNCLKGLFFGINDQNYENYTEIIHDKPGATSYELYKGILDDNAKGVFNGKIYVGQKAEKTNSTQLNKNILLSDGAKINTQPHLEIFTDDIKCAHGATIGQLDQESIFYLQSRGIDEKTAKQMLLMAFVKEVIADINDDKIKDHILDFVSNKFKANNKENNQ